MISIVIIEKNGSVKQVNMQTASRDKLYTKCGFKKSDGFEKRTVWNVTLQTGVEYIIELWARNDGRANTENKYDFPPPVDKDLYFGNCCLVRIEKETDNLISLTGKDWKEIYEHLFGGFEDIVEEEESEDELENVPEEQKTKSGYLKDGFVVNTDSDSEPSKNGSLSEETDNDASIDEASDSEDDESADSELKEETYYYSDED